MCSVHFSSACVPIATGSTHKEVPVCTHLTSSHLSEEKMAIVCARKHKHARTHARAHSHTHARTKTRHRLLPVVSHRPISARTSQFTHSLSLSLTHTHTHTHMRAQAAFHTLAHIHTDARTRAHTHTHSFALSLSLCHRLARSLPYVYPGQNR